jgi:PII-like signaling protein
VRSELLQLTAYFGERDRSGARFLAEPLIECLLAHEPDVAVLLRGAEGFGLKHHLRDDRLLTLSEDLPLVVVAVGQADRIGAARAAVRQFGFDGLLTLERARSGEPEDLERAGLGSVKLTVYAGRYARIDGIPLHHRVGALLRRHAFPAVTVLLGLDGVLGGERQRARFLARNRGIPLMIIGVGPAAGAAATLRELPRGLISTVERVRICRSAGAGLEPPHRSEAAVGAQLWQKLTVFSAESVSSGGRPQHERLVRELRREGARGATCLRGLWGYHDQQEPAGDRLWQLRRRVPMMTVAVDEPSRAANHLAVMQRLTGAAGVVTSELIPGWRATGPGVRLGDLELDQP